MLTPTLELVDHSAGQKLVSCKRFFKINEGIKGVQKPRYKVRLVACGFTQRAGIDYNEVFSPVVQHTSIRVIFALIVGRDYELEQVDVKTTFLHGILKEMIYMRQPLGYEQDDMLISCKIKADIGSTNSLLKKEFDMKELGEAKKILGMDIVRDYIRKIPRLSQSGYVSKVLNNFRVDNGKSVKIPLDGHFKLSLKDFPVRNYDVERMSKLPYENAVGSLMYLMVCTRPNIAYAAMLQHVVSLSTTEAEYMALTKAVNEAIRLRGLLEELGVELNIMAVLEAKTVEVLKVGTKHDVADALTKVVPGLMLQRCLELLSVGWLLLLKNYALQLLERAHIVTCNPSRTPVDTESKLGPEVQQICFYMHDPREPHLAALKRILQYVQETAWLRNLLRELHSPLSTATLVYCDNVSAVYMSANPVQHQRTKHIEIDIHFV
nr:hypothetical protein [Tanacetum cinerariifolium]